MKTLRALILGAGGMLGHRLVHHLSSRPELEVFATARDRGALLGAFAPAIFENVIGGVDATHPDSALGAIARVRPDVVINCVGIVKQLDAARDPLISISVNALFPHRLALACSAANARLIHISTDCVFSGRKGDYTEDDAPDATDLYGRTKLLGEVDAPHCVTLRTSLIGHELNSRYGLLEWFLGEEGSVRGFAGARFSGFPTTEMARIIVDRVMPFPDLQGVYHVSSASISKYELLELLAARYGRQTRIERDENLRCDRSLNSDRFRSATGYRSPPWPELVDAMYQDQLACTASTA